MLILHRTDFCGFLEENMDENSDDEYEDIDEKVDDMKVNGDSGMIEKDEQILIINTAISQWQNEVIQCNNNDECIVNCDETNCCRNATLNCPILNHRCQITCQAAWSCYNMDINWTPTSNNSLDCDGNIHCRDTLYPPPINDTTPYNITCDQRYKCAGTILQCPVNANCNIICSQSNSCRSSTVYCPTNADCNIKCSSTFSCEESIIYCPSNGKCNVECTGGSSSCGNSVVYWSQVNESYASLYCPSSCNSIQLPKILDPPWNDEAWTQHCTAPYYCHSATINCPTNGDCVVNCIGDHTCTASTINCPINGKCHIVCDGEESCTFAIFNGPIDNIFTIFCDGTRSCLSSVTHAQYSSYFNFSTGSSGSYTASATTFYFPPNNGTSPRAFILALYDGFNGYDGYGPSRTQQFYALNGWKDVAIDFSGSYVYHDGAMHCNIDYIDSCLFAENSWQCASTNTICDNPILRTTAPTQSTTMSPSYDSFTILKNRTSDVSSHSSSTDLYMDLTLPNL